MNSKKAINQFKEIKKLISGTNIRLAAEWNSKYKILIATMLSPQTRDETTISVCENLFRKYPSMGKLSVAEIDDIEKKFPYIKMSMPTRVLIQEIENYYKLDKSAKYFTANIEKVKLIHNTHHDR